MNRNILDKDPKKSVRRHHIIINRVQEKYKFYNTEGNDKGQCKKIIALST